MQRLLRTLRESPLVKYVALSSMCVLLGIAALDLRLSAAHHLVTTRRAQDDAVVASPKVSSLLALGHDEWMADVTWIRALLYFGETLAQHQKQEHLQKFADAIEALDPYFRPVYLWAATVSMYNTRGMNHVAIERAIEHLRRGMTVFPDDGEMHYETGFDYYFELPPRLESQIEKDQARRRGATFLRRASVLGYGPPWMALAAAEALNQAGMTDQALQQLRDQYLHADDPEMKQQIEMRIKAIAPGLTEDPFVAEVRRVEQDRDRNFPYLRLPVFLFVGPTVVDIRAARSK